MVSTALRAPPAAPRQRRTPAAAGALATVALMVVAVAVPPAFGWDVHASTLAPLAAHWRPRFGPGTVPAVLLALAALRWAGPLARRLAFGRLLLTAYAAGLGWLVALATVDGWGGISHVLGRRGEYLGTARATSDVGATLRHYIEHIPLHSVDNWPTHIAGHPPGALLFFVAVVRLGFGGPLAAGWVVVVIAATTPLAVLVTLRRLGAEPVARKVAPFLVFGPAAIWAAVSADAVFAAVAAWGLCCLAYAATAGGTARRHGATVSGAARRIGASLAAGVLLGYCVELSYGLPLLAVPALAILAVARSIRPLPWVLAGAAAVVAGFAAAGFNWWDALPVLRTRYYAGIASQRPAGYWVWGDLAALGFSAGPAAGAALAVVAGRLGQVGRDRAVVLLPAGAAVAVVLADLSFMSKAEVERIWLPFVPWLLVGAALLTGRQRLYALTGQVLLALAVQSLLYTLW